MWDCDRAAKLGIKQGGPLEKSQLGLLMNYVNYEHFRLLAVSIVYYPAAHNGIFFM